MDAKRLLDWYRQLKLWGYSPKIARICAYMRTCHTRDEFYNCMFKYHKFWVTR